LINLIRGTGPDGLTGIKAESNNLIRPLLSYTREEIENFAKSKDLKWREDSSNFSDKYMRNNIRHNIVPGLMELNPQMLETFAKTQQYLRGSLELVEDYMSLLYPKIIKKDTYGYSLNIDFLQKIPNPKQVLYQLLRSFGFTEWDDVYNLLSAQPGKMVFSETHRLIKDRNTLILTEKSDKPDDKEFWLSREEELVMIPDMGTLHLEEVGKLGKATRNCIYVPASKLQFPLHIRKWKKGDFFHPFGMKGKKKLSDFFKDEKFSLPEKENTWILCSKEDIVWIIGHRADNRFAVKENDSDILKISLT
jgi:tRNA(Ile)-lysidine synthase